MPADSKVPVEPLVRLGEDRSIAGYHFGTQAFLWHRLVSWALLIRRTIRIAAMVAAKPRMNVMYCASDMLLPRPLLTNARGSFRAITSMMR